MSNFTKHAIAAATLAVMGTTAHAASQPNILAIWGDDIGYGNISAYNQGMLGYQTPNIDRIAKKGAKFTSYYGQQSCTAGRAAFMTGQMPYRVGLTKVGLPGSKTGLSVKDMTLAEALKERGYATGQFGKNHFGDQDDMLPTNHGFDEFLGNLYHLNAEEEPENPDYPKDPKFAKRFGPRGVIHSYADGRIEDTGPLTRLRMETIDDETVTAAMGFMKKAIKRDQPFFVWYNATRMHIHTHLKDKSQGVTGLGFYADGMVEHDKTVGTLLDFIDKQGVADNTIIMYTTDNGPMNATWPDASFAPFRGEKNTGWEGGFRLPAMVMWPGHIPANTNLNQMFSAEDWFPTLLNWAGNKNIKKELLKGHTDKVNGRFYHNHLDGYDQTAYLTGKSDKSARNDFFYWSDDGELIALRFGNWKMHFMIQEHQGWDVWTQKFTELRIPRIYNLAIDPLEKADQGWGYDEWMFDRVFNLVPAQARVAQMMESFKQFPSRQEIPSFTVNKVIKQMERAVAAAQEAKSIKH